MNGNEQAPPVSADDFPEFAEPPRSAPAPTSSALAPRAEEEVDDAQQAAADAVMERLRRERSGQTS